MRDIKTAVIYLSFFVLKPLTVEENHLSCDNDWYCVDNKRSMQSTDFNESAKVYENTRYVFSL